MFSVYVKNFKFNSDHFKDRIVVLGKKWHIPKFIEFQYGTLNPDNRAHASVLSILEKEGASKGLARGLLAPKDMDMVKDKAKDKEVLHKDKVKYFSQPTIEQVRTYCREREKGVNPDKWMAYYQSNGWKVGKNPMKDWQAAVRTWEHNSFEPPIKAPTPSRHTILRGNMNPWETDPDGILKKEKSK